MKGERARPLEPSRLEALRRRLRTELTRRRDDLLNAGRDGVPKWQQERDLLELMALLASAEAEARELRRREGMDPERRPVLLPARRSTESA